VILSSLVLAATTAQRLLELAISRRHSKILLARGGVEYGKAHFYPLILLHAAWMIGLWVLAWDLPIRWPWLAVFVVLQGLRIWVIRTLGVRWSTRIIVLPGEPLVRTGPYRFVPHPNYLIVLGEVAALPLAFGLTNFALVFSLLNAAMLFVRIRVERKALGLGVA
jgi:methyltransferase